MVRMFWLLLGVYGFVTTLHGQWQELDAALTEQVNSGWLSGQERLCILDHLDRTGAPIALEEAWAIQGLTHAAAQALMQNVEWQDLVDRAQRQATGRGLAAEGRFARAMGVHSVRLRNPGKWGLRWDHGAAAVTGYVQASVGRGGQWRGLLGGHRLGWGNRMLVGEGVLFAGLDVPSFALPVQYGFAPMWGPKTHDTRSGVVVHREGRVASTLSVDAVDGDVAAVIGGNGQHGLIARTVGGMFAATAYVQGLSGMRQWIAEAGRLNHGWGLSGACQWLHQRTNEARLRFEVFKPDGTMELDLEASAGGEWRGDHWLVRWHVEWGNRSDVHPLWIKCRREWPEGVAAELHWRTAQTSGPDARASQRLEFRGVWKVDPLAFRFTLIPFADEGAPGAVSAFFAYQFGAWRFKQSVTTWTLDAGRRAYIPEPSWIGTSYRMLSGSGYRMASLLQFNHPNGWSWLAAVVRSNRPAALEVGDNMLTLTSAQTEFNLSIRMNL